MSPNGETPATSRILFKVRRRLVASTEYLATRPVVTEPKHLQDWDWLALGPVHNIPLAFSKAGGEKSEIKPDARISMNDGNALYQFARGGAGLAVVPEFLAEQDVATGQMAYVLPDWELKSIDVFATWPANAPKDGLIRLILGELNRHHPELRKG